MIGRRLALLFLYTFLLFGCATTQDPHSSEDSSSDVRKIIVGDELGNWYLKEITKADAVLEDKSADVVLEDKPADAGLDGESNTYDKILSAVRSDLKKEYDTAKNDIIALKPAWNPFSTKKLDSAEDAVFEDKSTTENAISEESSSDIIPSIEGLEVEEVSELGKSSTFEVEGEEYKRVWDVAESILKENFKIVESDKEKGTLKGDLKPFSDSWGEVVDVAINPANIESEKYSVEVVTNNKTKLSLGYNWTPDIIRAIKFTLGMEVAIEVEIEYKKRPKKGEIRPKTEIIIFNAPQTDSNNEEPESEATGDLLLGDDSVEQLSTEISDEIPQQVSTDEEAEQEIADVEPQPDSTDEQLVSDEVDEKQQPEKPDEKQIADDETDDLLLRDVNVEQLPTETSDEIPQQVLTDEEAEQEIADSQVQSGPSDEQLISDTDDDVKQTE